MATRRMTGVLWCAGLMLLGLGCQTQQPATQPSQQTGNGKAMIESDYPGSAVGDVVAVTDHMAAIAGVGRNQWKTDDLITFIAPDGSVINHGRVTEGHPNDEWVHVYFNDQHAVRAPKAGDYGVKLTSGSGPTGAPPVPPPGSNAPQLPPPQGEAPMPPPAPPAPAPAPATAPTTTP